MGCAVPLAKRGRSPDAARIPRSASPRLSLDLVRTWALAHDTATLRAIRRAKKTLVALRGRESSAWGSLAVARLALEDGSAGAEARLARALGSCDDPLLRARLLLACADHASDLSRARELATEAARSDDAEIATLATLRLVRIAQRTGDLPLARRLLGSLRATPSDGYVAASLDALTGMQLLAERHTARAQDALERAFRWAAGRRVDPEASEAAGMLGNALHDLGDLPGALRWYGFAITHATRCGAKTAAGIFALYRGWALAESGRRDAALASYARAERDLKGPPARSFRLHARALRALLRDDVGALAEVARAAAELESRGDGARARALSLLSAGVEATRAASSRSRNAAILGVLRGASALRTLATSDDERIALRMARAALARAASRVAKLPADLRVAVDGSALAVTSKRASLSRHPVLARMLTELVIASCEGRRCSVDDLVSACWPGEKILATAAKHRLHVALSSLRARGVSVVLDREGYALAHASLGLLAHD